jgi:DNA invertase Pin-like site-specific DNA recombinase
LNQEISPSQIYAAQYVRMSTEHQQYSTNNQSDKIREYADRRGIAIVRTYADEGKSGLSIGGRAALQRLIADVESGSTDFCLILVYDVSRWGRFQDADESAYYEYICKKNGIQVAYVAEQFENDGSPVSTIVKGVKRAMAGEYSRELSAKVFVGQCRLIELGYRQGGPAGYGLRRVLVDQAGQIKAVLARGEHKSLQTDRVILMPGPEDEVHHVRDIFRWLIDEDLSIPAIAVRLNGMGIRTDIGQKWTYSSVRQVLTNEKYIGNNVYNRRSFKLKRIRVINPPEMWIRREGAFEGIVAPEVFYTANQILAARASRYSDEELLNRLCDVYRRHGRLTGFIIDQSPNLPSQATYTHRFGSLLAAYARVGYRPERCLQGVETNRMLRRLYPEIVERTQHALAELGGVVWRDPKTDLLHLNQELVVNLVLARCQTLSDGHQSWLIRFDHAGYVPDITLAVRLDAQNKAEQDFLLLPALGFNKTVLRLNTRNANEFASFRFDSLEFFYGLGRRSKLGANQRIGNQHSAPSAGETPRSSRTPSVLFTSTELDPAS